MNEKKLIINDKSIEKYKPTDKDYRVLVAGHTGLFLRIYPNGKKVWWYIYTPTYKKSENKIKIGDYPAISFANAKAKWEIYHNVKKQGIDPQSWHDEQKRLKTIQDSNKFNLVCEKWANTQNWKANTRKDRNRSLALLCNYIGDKSMNDITTAQIVTILKDIENTHRQRKDPTEPSDKASRCRGFLIDIFGWAKINGYCDNNPMIDIKNTKSEYTAKNAEYGNRPAITEPNAFGAMLAKIEKAKIKLPTLHNLKLLAYLAVRNGDIRLMKWCEIDFDKRLWTFEPIKGESNSKIKMVKVHKVPLSNQVIQVLEQQKQLTGNKEYVFDNGKGGVISDNTAGKALNRLGYQDIHCPHGYRASAKTMLMQELDYNDMITEMVLGHIITSKEDPYNRADLLEKRTELMQTWADYIDDLMLGNDTTKYKGIYRQKPNDILSVLISMIGKDELIKLLKD